MGIMNLFYLMDASYFVPITVMPQRQPLIFYEANKIIRSRDQDAYDERRTLVVEECPLLGNPYYMLYNTTAFPSNKKDNTVSILSEEGKKIRGLVLIVKKVGENQFTWLEEEEARSIQNQINAIR